MVDTGVIVFARMGSARFPGKMLFPLLERPLLGHVLDRAALISGPHQIVVATSKMQNDDAIEDFVNSEGIRVYRGPLEDVATVLLTVANNMDLAGLFVFVGTGRLCRGILLMNYFTSRKSTMQT